MPAELHCHPRYAPRPCNVRCGCDQHHQLCQRYIVRRERRGAGSKEGGKEGRRECGDEGEKGKE